jgi:hypothetical protein
MVLVVSIGIILTDTQTSSIQPEPGGSISSSLVGGEERGFTAKRLRQSDAQKPAAGRNATRIRHEIRYGAARQQKRENGLKFGPIERAA